MCEQAWTLPQRSWSGPATKDLRAPELLRRNAWRYFRIFNAMAISSRKF